jgi:succinate dehydrogenase/fumarate reductase cytochrome b subunit
LWGSQSWLPPAKCGLTVALFVLVLLNNSPMTADFSAWYAGISLAITLLILAIAAFAFHSALGGRKLFQEGFLES